METMEFDDERAWQSVLDSLPAGYEEAAEALGALRRRREVRSAGDLPRLALVYSICDLSLRATAGWAAIRGVSRLSSVALLKRLRRASVWLGWLVVRMLVERASVTCCRWPVRILDASVVQEQGAHGANWRLHMGLDLARETIDSVELTSQEGGETFRRHSIVPGELWLADAGYSHRRGVAHVLDGGGHVVVRLNWQAFPLENESANVVDPLALFESLGVGEIGDWDLSFRERKHSHPIRLVVLRRTAEPTEQDITRYRRRAHKRGRATDPRSLQAACCTAVLTDLPREELPANEVLALYRLRWRIEMAFKRLKSVVQLDKLRAHDPQLVAAYLHTKLLGAILLEHLTADEPVGASPPTDRPERDAAASA